MASRRSYGTGSISRKKDGAWLVRIELGADPFNPGARTRISRTVRGTKTDAQRVLDQLRSEYIVSGKRGASDVTLRELIVVWRAGCSHSIGTSENYDRAFALVPDKLMDAPARQVTVDTLNVLFSRLLADGAALDRVKYLRAGLGGAFTAGVRSDYVARNPVKDSRPLPRRPRKRRQMFDHDTPRRLLQAADGPAERAWIALYLASGARKSEGLALRWCDMDLERNLLWIEAALDPASKAVVRKETKGRDQRIVPIRPALRAALTEWRTAADDRARAAGVTLAPDAYVFTDDPAGRDPWKPRNESNHFARIRDRARLSQLSLHGLRHMVGTLAQDAGIAPRKVQTYLGHADITTTMGYTGKLQDGAEEIADFLDGLMSG